MIKAGLTGGIGAGKSTVANLFKHLEVPVFEADTAARKIMSEDPEVRRYLTKWFGDDVWDEQQNSLNRNQLAAIIFKQPEALQRVNNLVHPLVRQAFNEWIIRHQNKPYVLHEAAILFETGFYRQFDYMLLVTATAEIRIKRLLQRGGLDETEIRLRMQQQWSEEQKRPLADYIIHNDGEEFLIPQVIRIHQQLLEKSNG